MKRERGFTLMELLIVIAVLGILASLAVMAWRNALQSQTQSAALHQLSSLFWRGATRAASEGQSLDLCKNGNTLTVREEGGSDCTGTIRLKVTLPKDVSVGLDDGKLLRFTPPGKLNFNAGSFQNPFTITTPKGSYQYEVSVVGEVRVTRP